MTARRWAIPIGVAGAVAAIAIGLPNVGRTSPEPAEQTLIRNARTTASPRSAAPPSWPKPGSPPSPGPHDRDLRAGRVKIGGYVDPGPNMATTVRDLATSTPFIAVVVAESQKSYWSDIGPTTATNYRVVRVIKGRLPSYVQVAEFGAEPNSFPDSAQAWMPRNEVAPTIGQRYVIFLAGDLGNGRYATRDGSNSRFEVVDGVVRSVRDRHPQADRAILIKPTPLREFIRSLARQ